MQEIESLEKELNTLEIQLAAPEFYNQPKDKILLVQTQHNEVKARLEKAYKAWGELEQ